MISNEGYEMTIKGRHGTSLKYDCLSPELYEHPYCNENINVLFTFFYFNYFQVMCTNEASQCLLKAKEKCWKIKCVNWHICSFSHLSSKHLTVNSFSNINCSWIILFNRQLWITTLWIHLTFLKLICIFKYKFYSSIK